MSLGSIGAVLAVLAVVFIIGRLWFAMVEGVLGLLKRLLGRKKTSAWHTPLPEQDKEESKDA